MGKKNLPRVWREQIEALSKENEWLRGLVDRLSRQQPDPVSIVEAIGKVINPVFEEKPGATTAQSPDETFIYPDHEFDESLEPRSSWPREGTWTTADQSNGSQADTGVGLTRNP